MKHEFKLIKETPSQRFYQLPKRCKIFPVIKDIVTYMLVDHPLKFNPKYELAESLEDGIDKVCISDAHTHLERLVFPAFLVKNVETGQITAENTTDRIGGAWTMMIHGGDESSMRPDLVYLRQIMILNCGKGN